MISDWINGLMYLTSWGLTCVPSSVIHVLGTIFSTLAIKLTSAGSVTQIYGSSEILFNVITFPVSPSNDNLTAAPPAF